MGKPYKREVTMQYTTVVYYNEDDWAVMEEEQLDHHSVSEGPMLDVTEEELDDYYA